MSILIYPSSKDQSALSETHEKPLLLALTYFFALDTWFQQSALDN
jgi:hypothetical protein